MDGAFTDFNEFKNGLDVVSQALGLMGDMTASKALSSISSDLGTATQTEQTGAVEGNGSSLTVITTNTRNISSNTKGGGPGVGDVIVFYKNMRVAWAYEDGQLQLCPFGHTYVTVTAAFLQNNLSTLGISSSDQQNLLSLDPFVAGGPSASLAPDRFTAPDGGEAQPRICRRRGHRSEIHHDQGYEDHDHGQGVYDGLIDLGSGSASEAAWHRWRQDAGHHDPDERHRR